MPYVRQYRTGDGYATALVETFVDDSGKPRTRVLADLWGAGSVGEALDRLADERESLRKEAVKLAPQMAETQKIYAAVRKKLEGGWATSFGELQRIDQLCKLRRRLIARVLQIEDALARIQRDEASIKRHCG